MIIDLHAIFPNYIMAQKLTMKISQQIFTYISGLSGLTAYSAIAGALLICGLGVPIPEDVTLLAAGVLVAAGNMSLVGAMLVGFFGVLAGDTLLFFLGRHFGARVFLLPGFRRVFTESRIALARQRIQQDARMICFVARFLPGLRAPIYLTAGVMHVRALTFFVQDGLAALLSVPLWVYLGYFFGENIDALFSNAKTLNLYLIGGVLILVMGYVGFKFFKRRQSKTIPPI